MFSIDEATGKPWLRQGALQFDDDGCSVYRTSVLDAMSLPWSAVKEPQYGSLAHSTAGAVRTFRSDFADEPVAGEFDVIPDPLVWRRRPGAEKHTP